MIAAALFDGFVVADIAIRLGGSAADQQAAYGLIAFCGILIQAFAKLGFILMASGTVFWGKALLHHKGAARWIGLLAIAIGGASVAFLLTTQMRFNVSRLLIYMTLQAIWHLKVAVWMIRGLKNP